MPDASPPTAQPEANICRPLTHELVCLDHENAERPLHTSEIFRLYAALWDNYNKRTAELRRLEEENYMLRSANMQLCHQLQALERRNIDQGAMLEFSKQGFENFRKGIRAVLEAWERNPSKAGPELPSFGQNSTF